VARGTVQQYAISARGFNSREADKLEVLLDGRSVYSPRNSSVAWDILDTYLPDIDRIEVIRGPGATLWGANAVNGVINIVTRTAQQSLGTEAGGGGGNEERSFGSWRSGGRFGETGAVRAYAQAFERDSDADPVNGGEFPDGFRTQQAGLRADWSPTRRLGATLSGDLYDAHGQLGPRAAYARGANVVGRLRCCSDAADRWSTQFYLDHAVLNIPDILGERRDTADVNLQFRQQLFGWNDFTIGAGYRVTRDETDGAPEGDPNPRLVFAPESRSLQTISAFLQDQIALSQHVSLTLGSKFEHNAFTGFELQPGVRLGWRATERVFAWSSVARAVRTPNRTDTNLGVYCGAGIPGFCGPGEVFFLGNPQQRSETLIAYEGGVRLRPAATLTFDIAAFHNDYDRLRSEETGGAFVAFDNKVDGASTGGELSAHWQPRDTLDVQLFYSYLELDVRPGSDSTDVSSRPTLEGSSPRHQAGLRFGVRPVGSVRVDTFVRFVDTLPAFGIPSYTELALRASWRVRPTIELSVTGENLLHPHHAEFGFAGERGDPQRSVFGELRWSWQ
jgi:iron complex outermembrane receptor protein